MSRLFDTWNEEIKDIDRQISELHKKRRDIQLKADAITIKAWQDSGELPYKMGDIVILTVNLDTLKIGQRLQISRFSLSSPSQEITADIKYLWIDTNCLDDWGGIGVKLHQIAPIS